MTCFLINCHVTQMPFSGGFPQCSPGCMRKVGWAKRRWHAPSTAAWAPCWWSLRATLPDSYRSCSSRKTPGSWARCFTSRLVSKHDSLKKNKSKHVFFLYQWSFFNRSGAGDCPQPETKSPSRRKQRRCGASSCTKWQHAPEEDQSGCSHLWYRWEIKKKKILL